MVSEDLLLTDQLIHRQHDDILEEVESNDYESSVE